MFPLQHQSVTSVSRGQQLFWSDGGFQLLSSPRSASSCCCSHDAPDVISWSEVCAAGGLVRTLVLWHCEAGIDAVYGVVQLKHEVLPETCGADVSLKRPSMFQPWWSLSRCASSTGTDPPRTIGAAGFDLSSDNEPDASARVWTALTSDQF